MSRGTHCEFRSSNGFLNRVSGVRLSPGPPFLFFQFHGVPRFGRSDRLHQNGASVIKVSYFFAALGENTGGLRFRDAVALVR